MKACYTPVSKARFRTSIGNLNIHHSHIDFIMELVDRSLLPAISLRSEEILGVKPWSFQVAAAESLLSQRDTVVIAPTGSGKSLTFRLPFLACASPEKAMIVIVTPLKAVQVDQARS